MAGRTIITDINRLSTTVLKSKAGSTTRQHLDTLKRWVLNNAFLTEEKYLALYLQHNYLVKPCNPYLLQTQYWASNRAAICDQMVTSGEFNPLLGQ